MFESLKRAFLSKNEVVWFRDQIYDDYSSSWRFFSLKLRSMKIGQNVFEWYFCIEWQCVGCESAAGVESYTGSIENDGRM